MFSKFARVVSSLRPSRGSQVFQARALSSLVCRSTGVVVPRGARPRSDMVPASQYDRPTPKMFHFMYVITTYWETIPLFFCSAVSILLVIVYVGWSCFNKVDLVFTPYNRKNISRTMDLCNPTVHKLVVINQKYECWSEMQCVLDKMTKVEKKLKARADSCPFAVGIDDAGKCD